MHQTVTNVLCTTLNTQQPVIIMNANAFIDNALAMTVYATCCSVSRSLGVSPATLVYQHDMLLDIPIIVDLLQLQNKQQVLIDENLCRQNHNCQEWNYAVGQEGLIKTGDPTKLEP